MECNVNGRVFATEGTERLVTRDPLSRRATAAFDNEESTEYVVFASAFKSLFLSLSGGFLVGAAVCV